MPLMPYFRRHLSLLTFAACCELIYLLYFVRRFPLLTYYQSDLDMGKISDYSTSGFVGFLVMFTVLFAVFAAAWWVAHEEQGPGTIWLVLGLGAVFGVTMTFAYPMTAIDIFAYVDQSLVMVWYHHNPIFTPPAAFPNDPLMLLAGDWRDTGAPYGPLALIIDAIPTLLAGRDLLANLILLKLMFSAMTVGAAYLAYLIVRRTHPPLAVPSALLIAWNPLLIFEVSANGHNDIAMMVLALLALFSLLAGDLTVGPLLLVASALVKYTTILLWPHFLIYGLQRRRRRRAQYLAMTGVLCLALVVAVYLSFWQGLDTLQGVVSQNQRDVVSFGMVLSELVAGVIPLNLATALGRAIFLAVYAYTLWLVGHRPEELPRAAFLATFALVVFALSNFETWYAIWPVTLGAVSVRPADRVALILFSYGTALIASFFGYVWVWLGLTVAGFTLVDTLSYVVAFVPAVVMLVLLTMTRTAPRLPTPAA